MLIQLRVRSCSMTGACGRSVPFLGLGKRFNAMCMDVLPYLLTRLWHGVIVVVPPVPNSESVAGGALLAVSGQCIWGWGEKCVPWPRSK